MGKDAVIVRKGGIYTGKGKDAFANASANGKGKISKNQIGKDQIDFADTSVKGKGKIGKDQIGKDAFADAYGKGKIGKDQIGQDAFADGDASDKGKGKIGKVLIMPQPFTPAYAGDDAYDIKPGTACKAGYDGCTLEATVWNRNCKKKWKEVCLSCLNALEAEKSEKNEWRQWCTAQEDGHRAPEWNGQEEWLQAADGRWFVLATPRA